MNDGWHKLTYEGAVVGAVEVKDGAPLRVSDQCADADDAEIRAALALMFDGSYKLGPWGLGLGEHDSLADVVREDS